MKEQKSRVAAIGKIIFDTPKFSWSIPHTHFIVYKTDESFFEATNLELILDSSGNNLDEAIQSIARLTSFHIMQVMFRGRRHDELVETVADTCMEDLWKDYRVTEMKLSKTKNDLSHKIDRQLTDAIREQLNTDIRNIIYEKAKEDAGLILEDFNKLNTDSISLDIEYRELEAA